MVIEMKKEYFVTLCLIVLIAGIAGFVFVAPPRDVTPTDAKNKSPTGQYQNTSGDVAGGPLSYNIVVNAPKVNVPEKIPVYKTVPPAVTRADAIALAKKFNIINIGDINEG